MLWVPARGGAAPMHVSCHQEIASCELQTRPSPCIPATTVQWFQELSWFVFILVCTLRYQAWTIMMKYIPHSHWLISQTEGCQGADSASAALGTGINHRGAAASWSSLICPNPWSASCMHRNNLCCPGYLFGFRKCLISARVTRIETCIKKWLHRPIKDVSVSLLPLE